jgi:hypothetical protein
MMRLIRPEGSRTVEQDEKLMEVATLNVIHTDQEIRVLRVVQQWGPVIPTEIARRSDLSVETVQTTLERLLKGDYVHELYGNHDEVFWRLTKDLVLPEEVETTVDETNQQTEQPKTEESSPIMMDVRAWFAQRDSMIAALKKRRTELVAEIRECDVNLRKLGAWEDDEDEDEDDEDNGMAAEAAVRRAGLEDDEEFHDTAARVAERFSKENAVAGDGHPSSRKRKSKLSIKKATPLQRVTLFMERKRIEGPQTLAEIAEGTELTVQAVRKLLEAQRARGKVARFGVGGARWALV